ncbi:MAG: DNA-binding response regulator [Gammaproteobacteria bacterium]|jgi:FixJ family two-component response regulator|nr:DNA-binding response regulator [Gammaproteobacteria bacterium]
MNRNASVFIVDDDDAVRSSLRLLLKSVGLPAIAYASATDFLSAWQPEQPGCLVLDVRMPGMSGLELQHELNRRGAIIPVIFITGHADIPMAVEAIQHGAFDFLQKPFRDQDLIDRVQRALTTDAQQRSELAKREMIRERFDSLTPREREVLTLVTRGKANKVMAGDLGVSQRTVEIHRARVMEKMGAASLAQLVRMMLDLETQSPSTRRLQTLRNAVDAREQRLE